MDEAPSDLTILEAIAALRDAGFAGDFSVRDGSIRCDRCHHAHTPGDHRIDVMYRIEGASDPADEALVAGVTCHACGTRGVLVAGYGPTADPAEADVVRQLVDGRHP